jgi:hypothetical protein
MKCAGHETLKFAEQPPVQENDTVRGAVDDLDTALLRDCREGQASIIYGKRQRTGGTIPSQRVDEQRGKRMVSEAVGKWGHHLRFYSSF